MTSTKDFVIQQGKTFPQVLRWECLPIIYKPITAISKTAPVRITAVGHGIPAGWRAVVVSAKGMTQINAENTPPKDGDYHQATVIDVDNVEFNDVNAADFKTYLSGGYLQYNTPVDLAGFTARMSIKDKIGGTELVRLDTTNGGIAIDNVLKTITITMSATATAALTWKKAVYDLELVSASGVVTELLKGTVTVAKEVTTT
jgi:hypothetical protein